MSFARACHYSSSSEADLQSCHRFERGLSTDTSADGEPKECGEHLAMTRVLAQQERHRRAEVICGY
jgi:hypothetical protein